MSRLTALPVLLIICSIISGCSSSYYAQNSLDKNWGRSWETARFNQRLNPDAPENMDPVTGLYGKAATNSLEQYQNSFQTKVSEEEKPEFNIILTGGNN